MQTAGQVFLVGADNILDRFSFWFDDRQGPPYGPSRFTANVMEWTGSPTSCGMGCTSSRAAAPALYQSAPRETTNNGGAGGFEELEFLTGGLALRTGTYYVAFLTVAGLYDSVYDAGEIRATIYDAYGPGNGFVAESGNDFNRLTTERWYNGFGGSDLAFRASFSSVPEPGTLATAALGACLLLGLRRRRPALPHKDPPPCVRERPPLS